MLLQAQQGTEVTAIVSGAAAVVAAIGAFVTALLVRSDTGRHWRSVETLISREAEVAKERDKLTRELLTTETGNINRRFEDFTRSVGERLDSSSRLFDTQLRAQEASLRSIGEKQEAGLKNTESSLASRIQVLESQIATRLAELRTAIEGKADVSTNYLAERLKEELATVRSNERNLEERQRRMFGLIKKKASEPNLEEPLTQG